MLELYPRGMSRGMWLDCLVIMFMGVLIGFIISWTARYEAKEARVAHTNQLAGRMHAVHVRALRQRRLAMSTAQRILPVSPEEDVTDACDAAGP